MLLKITELILLIFPTYKDLKSHEVPLWFFPINYFLIIGYFIYLKDFSSLKTGIIWLVILLSFGLLQSYFFGLGGADALFFGALGLIYGIQGLNIVLLSFVLSLPYLICRKAEKEYAFFPYIWVANFIYFIKELL